MSSVLVAVMVIGVIVSGDLTASQRRPLDAYLVELTGPSFVKCGELGSFPTEAEARAVVACIDRHREAGTPAVMTQRLLINDSDMAHGLVVDKQRRLLRFNYDSGPCCGPTGNSRFESAPCLSVIVGPASPIRFVGCRPER